MMKKLKVNLDEITGLMEMRDSEDGYYLDLQTGKTVIIPSDLMYGGFEDDDHSSLPDWEKELVPIAKEIDEGSERYVHIPERESHDAYDDMVRFTETMTNENLREKLFIALDGRGAFRRFKNVIHNHPAEADRWYAYEEEATARQAREWLTDMGIEPIEGTD